MQAFAFVCVAVPLGLVGGTGLVWGNPYEKTRTDRVLSLITQLGDDEFAKREAASRELEGIGEPALGALQNAVASSGDLEVRRRAERIIQMIVDRAAKTDKERLQGTWTVVRWSRDGVTEPAKHFQGIRVIFNGDKVELNAPAGFVYPYELGATEKPKTINLVTDQDRHFAIPGVYALSGHSLKICFNANAGRRPSVFLSVAGSDDQLMVLKRLEP